MLDLRRTGVMSLLAVTACRSSNEAPAPAATVIPAPPSALEAAPRPSATAPPAAASSAAPTAAEDDGPEALKKSCPAVSPIEIALGKSTKLDRGTRYRIAETRISLCLLSSSYPLVKQGGHHRHAMAVTIVAAEGDELLQYDLVGPQSFVFGGYEVSYEAAGRISHTEAIDISVTVTRKGGPVRL
ncbi:hypothetical protein [Polyangium sp. y55x31]|uniref:hypothetical protein n=1 Tax=Polyangium sp. y55x31 TaxID=3042688 RepID=UPI0024825FC6|nr:hypothetical protein [Polyangium sp. y55x31]MDI1476836.1 hypothetical protein [Polyangium sp. y55x31]